MHRYNVAPLQQAAYTRGMNAGLGGYVKTLRVRQKLTQTAVLQALKERHGLTTDRSTLYRAEQGRSWPEGDLLAALMDVLGGRIEDLGYLQRHPESTAATGAELADKWIAERGAKPDVDTLSEARTRVDAEELASDLEELAKRIRAGLE